MSSQPALEDRQFSRPRRGEGLDEVLAEQLAGSRRALQRGQRRWHGVGQQWPEPTGLERIGQRLAPQPVGIEVGVVARKVAVGSVGEHGEDRAAHAARAHPREIEVAAWLAACELRMIVGCERIVMSVEHGPHRRRP